MNEQTVGARSETNEGTDRPWERPGQAAQEPHAKLADSKTRQREYENCAGGSDSTTYQQTSSPTASTSLERLQTSNAVDEEGKVGDPLPIALLGIVATPILLLIAALIWWMAR